MYTDNHPSFSLVVLQFKWVPPPSVLEMTSAGSDLLLSAPVQPHFTSLSILTSGAVISSLILCSICHKLKSTKLVPREDTVLKPGS